MKTKKKIHGILLLTAFTNGCITYWNKILIKQCEEHGKENDRLYKINPFTGNRVKRKIRKPISGIRKRS